MLALSAAFTVILAQVAAPPMPEPEAVDWLRQHAVRIKSIDPGEDEFADLQPLKNAIGHATIVQLGEQSHGDGAVFLAKCRLIAFLHQEMGFDVVVWESGVFDCRRANQALQDPDRPIVDAWKAGIFGIWALSAQAQPVLRYTKEMATLGQPLEHAGYDCQFSSGDAGPWLQALGNWYKPLGENHPVFRVLEALEREKRAVAGYAQSMKQTEGALQGLNNLAELTDAFSGPLRAQHGEVEYVFMRRTIDDAVASVKMSQHQFRAQQGDPEATNYRDQRMGENLIWLAQERYPGRKLIVWAATMHQVHDVTAIKASWDPNFYAGSVTAGTVARAVLKEQMYSIAFDAHTGSVGTCFQAQPRRIEESPPGSFGSLCAQVGHPFLFVDFRNLEPSHWLRKPIVARPLGYAPTEAIWPQQADAMFFIHTMFPSTQEEMAPADAMLTIRD